MIASTSTPTRVALIGAGRMGSFHAESLARRIPEADQAILAARNAGVALQVGFNRRFAADFRAAHDIVVGGGIGTPQLLRSVTRDPGLANPGGVPPWTIYRETLIHDFDALLWFNPGARPVEVFAAADALVAPDHKDSGLLDTSVVIIRFDNGAIATAEANFSAAYGYDVRGEVFGSDGMVTAGSQTQTAMRHYTATGMRQDTVRGDAALFRDAYTSELASFIAAVRSGSPPEVTGDDVRAALAVALAAIESVKANRPVRISEVDPA